MKGDAAGSTRVTRTAITVTLEKEHIGNSLLVAHEGVHASDGKDWQKTRKSVSMYETEFNAYTAQALVGQELTPLVTRYLNAKVAVIGKGGRVINGIPMRAEISNPAWRDVDKEVLRTQGINLFLKTPKILGGPYELLPGNKTPAFK